MFLDSKWKVRRDPLEYPPLRIKMTNELVNQKISPSISAQP